MSTALPAIEIVLLAAVADNGVIGRDNALPWRLSSDLKRFKALTMGKPVVMGRKTFLSIGKPLAGRTNIVLTRDRSFAAPGVIAAATFEAALESARGDASRRGADAIFIIGGTDIFQQAMPHAHRLEITEVHCRPEGDAVMSPVDERLWRESARSDHAAGPQDEAAFSYVTYLRADRVNRESQVRTER